MKGYENLEKAYRAKTIPKIKVIKNFTIEIRLYIIGSKYNPYNHSFKRLVTLLQDGFITIIMEDKS